MASVGGLHDCAAGHLRDYTDPTGTRAFQTYDRQGAPDRLDPVDVLAPAFLNASLKNQNVIAMFGGGNPYANLLHALTRVVEDPETAEAKFEDQHLDAEDGPWWLVRVALRASESTSDIKASKVSKILHRKRPHLVPIFDSKVAAFYGVGARAPWTFWPFVQADVQAHRSRLTDLAEGVLTPDGRSVSALRVLDIVVWEHVVTRCSSLSI